MRLRAPAIPMLAALCQPAAPAAQPPPSLVIVEPLPGRALRGPCTLRARLAPERLPVLRLTFTADGRLVCAREAPPWECAWDAGEGFASHSIRAVAMLADGSRLVDSVRTEAAAGSPPAAADVAEVAADVVEVAVDVVQVAAAVTDGEGRRVRGLGPADFRVFEDDRPQQVSHFIGDEAERELVVAVDMSGSMSEAMPVCRAAVKRFLSTLRPADRVTLLAFNDSVFTVARRDAAPETRLRALDRLRAWGSTAFHDAVLRGLDLVENHRGRRALVVFSDGEDMVSHATVEDVLARIEVSATPLYLIAQGEGMRQQRLKRVIDRIAGVSGGRSFYTKRIEQLGGVFAEIGEDLASQYLLAYVPESAVAQDAVWRTIRVEVAKRPNAYTVRARQGYRALARGRWP